jgi:hypothetical protein
VGGVTAVNMAAAAVAFDGGVLDSRTASRITRIAGPSGLEAAAHFLAGFEEGHALAIDRDGFARAGIASEPGIALTRGEYAEAAQLDPSAFGKLRNDLIEEGGDDQIEFARSKARMRFRQKLDQFRTDHDAPPRNDSLQDAPTPVRTAIGKRPYLAADPIRLSQR